MREYSTARTIFGILEFVAWVAVIIGIVVAIRGADAVGRYGGGAALAAAVPGLILSLVGIIAVATVQFYRAGVDSARIAGKMYLLALEQRRERIGDKPLPTVASFSAVPGASLFDTGTQSSDRTSGNTAETRPANAGDPWDVEYRGHIIKRTTDGMIVNGQSFDDISLARQHIDGLVEAAEKLPLPGAGEPVLQRRPE